MGPDVYLVLGVTLGALSIPALVSAFSDSRAPRAAAILILISAVLILGAVLQKPGGYTVGELPDVFADVIRGLMW